MVSITVNNALSIDGSAGQSAGAFTGISSRNGLDGVAGGTLSIHAGSLSLVGGGQISGTTTASGTGSDVTIKIDNAASIDGGSITTETTDDLFGGKGGDILLSAQSLSITNGGLISARSLGSGDGGMVALNITGGLTIDGTAGAIGTVTGISAETSFAGRGGAGGAINISAGATQLLGGAQISTATSGSGLAGAITLNLTAALSINGTGTQITSSASSTGNASNIFITASGPVSLTGGALISSSSLNGNAGGVAVNTNDGSLTITDATITATAADSAGSIVLTGPVGITIAGTSNISAQTQGLVSSSSAGSVSLVTSGPLSISGSTVSAEAAGQGTGGSVTINASTFSSVNSQISSSSTGMGNAGSVSLNSEGTLSLDQSSQVLAQSTLTSGGDVIVTSGGAMTLSNSSSISAQAPQAGQVSITAPSLTLTGGSSITTNTALVQAAGQKTDITLNVGSLSLDDSNITASTSGAGAGGAINIGSMNGGALPGVTLSDQSSVSADTSGIGSAGSVTINSSTFSATNAQISSSSTGAGLAGSVTLMTTGTLMLDQSSQILARSTLTSGGDVIVTTGGAMTLSNSSSISAQAPQAGQVSISAPSLALAGGSSIITDTTLIQAVGQKTDITLNVGTLGLNDSKITASTSGAAAGGTITVEPESPGATDPVVHLTDGSTLSASSSGSGAAGSVVVNASSLTVSGTQIASSSTGSGDGGSVMLKAAGILMLNQNSSVSATSTSGAGGSIILTGKRGFDIAGSSLATNTGGAGGSITLSTGANMNLSDTHISAAARSNGDITFTTPRIVIASDDIITARVQGKGGKILFDPSFVLLENTSINGTSLLGGQHDVLVTVLGGPVIADASSQIESSRQQLTLDLDIASEVGRLPGALASSGIALADVCGVNFSGDTISSFVITGRGASPIEPGGWLPSFDLSDGSSDAEQGKRKK